jgi:hypothetical protein
MEEGQPDDDPQNYACSENSGQQSKGEHNDSRALPSCRAASDLAGHRVRTIDQSRTTHSVRRATKTIDFGHLHHRGLMFKNRQRTTGRSSSFFDECTYLLR